MRHNLIGAALIALFLTIAIQADAQTVLFDFRATGGNGVLGAPPNFDPSIAGDTVTVGGLNLTIADITFPEYELVDLSLIHISEPTRPY